MKTNDPIFADLSTYNPNETIPFYENVFGWKFYEEYDYHTAFLGNDTVAGLYETPLKYKQMRMPHFWMTYIQVNDVDETVEQAKSLGGIIEMHEKIPYIGKVALIRDPLGAGFTIYEGSFFKNTRTTNVPNTLVWNELHTSKLDNAIPFYQGIFNWNIVKETSKEAQIFNSKNEHIADIYEIPTIIKGKYNYWVSSFSVLDLKETKKKIISNGGKLVIDEKKRMLFTDNSKEAFFYISQITE